MTLDDAVRLRHMIEAASAAIAFIDSKTRVDLDGDRILLFALVRAVEIVGEAASRVSQPTRDAMPAIPWTQIVGMRNRLIHAYFDVDADVLWQTVSMELPPLLPLLRTHVGAA